jgi:hypothetical protein
MRITSTAHRMRYVIKVSRNADVPLMIKTGPMIGSPQGLSTLQPFHQARKQTPSECFYGRDVDLYHEIPCWTSFGLQHGSVGHKRQVSKQYILNHEFLERVVHP